MNVDFKTIAYYAGSTAGVGGTLGGIYGLSRAIKDVGFHNTRVIRIVAMRGAYLFGVYGGVLGLTYGVAKAILNPTKKI